MSNIEEGINYNRKSEEDFGKIDFISYKIPSFFRRALNSSGCIFLYSSCATVSNTAS